MAQLIPSPHYHMAEHQTPERGFNWFELEQMIQSIGLDIGKAARSGDTAEVGRLQARRATLKRQQHEQHARDVAPVLEAERRRQVGRPAPGERGRLTKERKRLTEEVHQKEKAKTRLLAKAAHADDGRIIERAADIDDEVEDLRGSIEAVERRLGQITEYQEEMCREKVRTTEQRRNRKLERAQERNVERLKSLAEGYIASFAKKHSTRPFLDGQATASRVVAGRNGNVLVEVTVKIEPEVGQ